MECFVGRLTAEMMDTADPAPPAALVLSGPLTASVVVDIRARMLAHLELGATCEIRAAEVTQLDGAGAQLLYAFFAEAQRRGCAVTWTSASVYLVEAACMLGMDRCLGLAGLPPEVTSWQP